MKRFFERKFVILILAAALAAVQGGCRLLGAQNGNEPVTPTVAANAPQAAPTDATMPQGATPSPALESAGMTVVPTADASYGSIARGYLNELVSEIGPRAPGSGEERAAADYIQSALEAMGYRVVRQPFSVVRDGQEKFDSANLLAVKEGLSRREIVVGAHYDSSDDGLGADDNASGVAVLLEAAQRVQTMETPYTVRFIAFGAEESGLDGSYNYVSSLSPAQLQNIAYMVNLDSLAAGDVAYVYGNAGSPGSLRDWILEDARTRGFDLVGRTAEELDPPDDPCECSDYYTFSQAGIPYAYFEATNWDLGEKDGWTQTDPKYGKEGMIWHTRFDTLDYIEQIAPGRIDEHLAGYAAILVDALTKYRLTE